MEIGFILGFGGWFVYSAVTLNPIYIFGQAVQLNIGELIEFYGYVEILIWPMIALGQIITMASRSRTSLRRISNFLETEEDIKNPENPVYLGRIKGNIEFNHFSFAYPNSSFDSLNDISLKINHGEKIGVVGKIGSGKTTLVNVLLRLYNVNPDSIYIDGNDMMDCDINSLRENIAYSPQDNFLFSDEIRNNIAFSSDEALEDQYVEAAKFADVHDNVVEFTNGYETVSGERGVTLSGGQKQRISIARAYYKQTPIIILDDSVSAVDVKTEETILHNIENQCSDSTVIVVASRVSTVMRLDKIIVLDEGRLVAFDSHENLMKTSPEYQRMVYLQELEKEVEGVK